MSEVLTHVGAAADTVVFTIAAGGIVYAPVTVRTRPAGNAHFVIQNHDAVAYTVRIPFAEFNPYANAPSRPIDEMSSGKETRLVEANGNVTFTYKIKPSAHFPIPRAERQSSTQERAAFRYKYTLYYASVTTKLEKPVDPDLEVSS